MKVIIAFILAFIMVEITVYLIQGFSLITGILLWRKFKNNYKLNRFKPKPTDVILWEKNPFNEIIIRFKIIDNEKRKIHEFRLLINKNGNIVRVDHYNNDFIEFFDFLGNDRVN